MWRIILHSLIYYKTLFVSYVFIILALFFYDMFTANNPNNSMGPLLANIIIFLIFNTIGKEKWERLHVTLPVPIRTVAGVRTLILVIPAVGVFLFYCLLFNIFQKTNALDYVQLIFLFGIFIGFYLIASIFRDIYCSVHARINFILICTAIVAGIGLLGFLIFLILGIFHIFPLFEKLTPILGEVLLVMLLVILVSLASLTIFSFNKRKSYL